MTNSAFMPIVLAALSLTTLFLAASPPAQAAPDPDVQAVGRAGSDFGFRLLHLLATDGTKPPDAMGLAFDDTADFSHMCQRWIK